MGLTLVCVSGWSETKAHILVDGAEKTLCNRRPTGPAGEQSKKFMCRQCVLKAQAKSTPKGGNQT